MHVVGLGQGLDLEPLEQGQNRERGESLGRRRKARGLAAAVGNAQRLDPLGPVARQIVGGQGAAGGTRGSGEAATERAAIERVAPAPGDLLQGRRQISLDEPLALQELGVEDGPERTAQIGRRRVTEEIRRVGGLATLAGRGREAVARVSDRRLEERAPGDRGAQESRLSAWAAHQPETTPGTVSAATPPRTGIAWPKRARYASRSAAAADRPAAFSARSRPWRAS